MKNHLEHFLCKGDNAMLKTKIIPLLGRDYLKVGQLMEILRVKGVRLIVIKDGVDSINGDGDFTPFRNIMNEMFSFYDNDCTEGFW